MLQPAFQLSDVGHTIQLAVAPAFLLTAVGALLGVMSARLGRIVDRARLLEERAARGDAPSADLATLGTRVHLINWAIALCVGAGLLVAATIVTLFATTLLGLDASVVLALLFIAAMACLVGGLLFFLREVLLATRHVRVGR
jgi:hypothetical protein